MKMTCSVCAASAVPGSTWSRTGRGFVVVNSNNTWVGKPSTRPCPQLSRPPFRAPRLAQLLGSFMCFVFAVACRINGIIYNLFLPETQVLKQKQKQKQELALELAIAMAFALLVCFSAIQNVFITGCSRCQRCGCSASVSSSSSSFIGFNMALTLTLTLTVSVAVAM